MRRSKAARAVQPASIRWFGGLWLAIGLLFLAIALGVGLHDLRVQSRLDSEARVAEGMVLEKWIRRGSGSAGRRGETTNYRVSYRFTTASGERVKGEAEVPRARWDALVERERVRVTYLPDAPGTHRIDGETSVWVLPAVFGGLGLVFAGVGGVILFRARKR
jgi:hypothetical protein